MRWTPIKAENFDSEERAMEMQFWAKLEIKDLFLAHWAQIGAVVLSCDILWFQYEFTISMFVSEISDIGKNQKHI